MDLYELLKDAWLTPQLEFTEQDSLRTRVHEFFERALGAFDREEYSRILYGGLTELLDKSFFRRFPGEFDLCAVEYRSLAPRIAGEASSPESSLFLFGSHVPAPDLLAIENVMRAAYGRELTYLSLIPHEFGWLQVVYHQLEAMPELPAVTHTLDLPIREDLDWLKSNYGTRWFEKYLVEDCQQPIKDEIKRRLGNKVRATLQTSGSEKDRLADMVASTPFMSFARMSQTAAVLRSILYLPAYLHGERLGGAVLMGPRRVDSPELMEALHMTLQILLTHLRLVEFPEEARLAERDVLLRQFVRRFRHNMLHPLGHLMDSARRFENSFRQLLVTFERGIEAWKPDLMPNPIVTFLNYIADEFRSEEEPGTAFATEAAELGGPEGEEEESEDAFFPILVQGIERIEHFDRSILAEVLRNLLTNTARYVLRRGLKRVEIDAGEEGRVIIYREIGGPGLPPTIAADPWRLHAREPNEEESTGQGLFLTKKLIGVHGGDIEYERDESGGCKFKISLQKEGNGANEQNA